MPPTPTMEDIARRAGVHRATVSNVLNGRLKSERSDAAERARRIRRIAEEMGYRPSLAARATRTGQTGLIGMIRSSSQHHSVHEPAFETGVDDSLHRLGMCLVRDIIDDDAASAPRIVEENVVDGLLINYAFGTPPAVRNFLDRCNIPAIWINRKRDANCVRPNDEGAVTLACERLLQHRHKKVAFLTLNDETAENVTHYSQGDRESGYVAAMRAAGLAPRVDRLEAPADPHKRKQGWLLDACIDYLGRLDRPTAVLANCDGRTLMHAAEVLRLRIPQDLSLIAVDNDASSDEKVAFDRLLVPFKPMGAAAVSEICQLVEDPGSPRKPVLVPFEYHRKGTTGLL